MARADAPEHAAAIDDLKDQLLIVLIKRLAVDSVLDLTIAEIDDTTQDTLAFSVDFEKRIFHFVLGKKT